MSERPEPIALVERFWDALYDRDWPRIGSFFTDESVYWDVPTGPTTAAKGPAAIEARLRLGLEGLSGYEHTRGAIVGGDGLVVTEHAETWHWETGETVTLPFVSVQEVDGEHILVWRDYWDYQTLWNAAPQAWHDRLLTADLWWLHDASSLVVGSGRRFGPGGPPLLPSPPGPSGAVGPAGAGEGFTAGPGRAG